MKLEEHAQLPVLPEKAWNLLISLKNYPDWNPIFVNAEGVLETGGSLRLRLCVSGRRPKNCTALVSAIMPGKYLSLQVNSSIGSWWLQSEYVFRLKPAANGKTLFIAELYCHGLSLRVSRSRLKREFGAAMARFVREFCDRCDTGALAA